MPVPADRGRTGSIAALGGPRYTVWRGVLAAAEERRNWAWNRRSALAAGRGRPFRGKDSRPLYRPGTPIPWAKPHFQSLEESEKQVADAISPCDREAFELAVHRGQDYWPHYEPGYRPPFGHTCAGHEPDDTSKHLGGWFWANEWTKKKVKEWNAQCNQPYAPSYYPLHCGARPPDVWR